MGPCGQLGESDDGDGGLFWQAIGIEPVQVDDL
jgi:hypothetical protein